jgi:hypothetical protein
MTIFSRELMDCTRIVNKKYFILPRCIREALYIRLNEASLDSCLSFELFIIFFIIINLFRVYYGFLFPLLKFFSLFGYGYIISIVRN